MRISIPGDFGQRIVCGQRKVGGALRRRRLPQTARLVVTKRSATHNDFRFAVLLSGGSMSSR